MSPENGPKYGPDRDHLVSNSGRPPPENKYCAPRRSEMFRGIRSLTSGLGRFCETTVSSIWQNPPNIKEGERIQLAKAISAIGLALTPARKSTMRREDINDLYQAVAADNKEPWLEDRLPQNENLATIFNILDELGIPLLREYRKLTQTQDVRYLVEAALIVAKEICQPGLNTPGVLLSDVRLPQYTQLDAVLIPYAVATPCSLEELLNSGQPYEIVEIKTILRASKTSGPDKLRTLPLGFLREQQGRLATVILWWLSQGHEHFPFPRAIQVVCLRGLLPTIVHEVKIDTGFLDAWRRCLNINFDNTSGEQKEDLRKLIPVIGTELELQTKSLRERMGKAQEWLEAHRNEKFEQGPLF